MVMGRALRAAVGLAAGTVVVLAPASASASAASYVALGDSYSSGTGTRSYISDGTSCQRSVYAYPSLIASSKGYALNFRACSGASTADVASLQLGALGSGTAYVSITVGGNDAGFAAVLTECAKPAWMSNCNGAIDRARSTITNQLPVRLTSLYSAIRERAANAKIVVAGYPRLFNGEDCSAGTWFSPTEMARLNSTGDLLNSTMATAAGNAGFDFSNVTPPFTGHAVCDSTEWINGLSYPVSESYHPNRLGHSSGYTPIVGLQLTGSSVTVSATTTQQAAASGARLAAQQRPYAVRDRTIRPKRFLAPDLSSADARAAAARAGVDLSSRTSIDAADRKYDALQNRLTDGKPG
jgi:lysophospholipase L1-like esterase